MELVNRRTGCHYLNIESIADKGRRMNGLHSKFFFFFSPRVYEGRGSSSKKSGIYILGRAITSKSGRISRGLIRPPHTHSICCCWAMGPMCPIYFSCMEKNSSRQRRKKSNIVKDKWAKSETCFDYLLVCIVLISGAKERRIGLSHTQKERKDIYICEVLLAIRKKKDVIKR